MDSRNYYIRISPENIDGDIFKVPYTGDEYLIVPPEDPCCVITGTTIVSADTGYTYVYSSMTQVLTGGPNGTSLLTGLTIPILLTENTIDIGYYSVFDGLAVQQDTMLNFLFSANTGQPYRYYFYNTSDREFKKYLSFSDYVIDWGDGSPIETVNSISPVSYSHTYPISTTAYTITMSGMSPWGMNVIQKEVYVPFTPTTILNPMGEAFFIPQGGSWSGTPLSYYYIFSGDSTCDMNNQQLIEYTNGNLPFRITGITQSSINDLIPYGPRNCVTKLACIFPPDTPITGSSGVVGIVYSSAFTQTSTGYTINGVDYVDYKEGYTIFSLYSSGITADMMVCSAITKNEVLLGVIDEPQIQSNVFVERGKVAPLESFERLNEVDNVGDLEKYGYKYFTIINV